MTIDGKRVGKLKRSSSIVLELKPGHHDIQGRIDLAVTPALSVTVREGDNVRVEISAPTFTVNPFRRKRGLLIRRLD